MRAYENVSIYCEIPEHAHRRRMKQHKKRIKNAQPVIKFHSRERKLTPRAGSPQKGKGERQDEIAKNNMILARRIFDIMEGPGIISNLMENSVTDNHPGTINFAHRLSEAKRIHQENMVIASRLDSVKAYYDTTSVRVITTAKKNRRKKLRGLSTSRKSRRVDASASGRVVLGNKALKITSDFDEEHCQRPRNVLLEYTKIQKGCVLDIAVIKEPFRDSYSIFGIDIDNGQRYELRLTSEEVSNILEGDILVTSVDNIEVWMALLNKVELHPVESFAKISLPSSCRESDQHAPIAWSQGQSPNNQSDVEKDGSIISIPDVGDVNSLTEVSIQQKAGSISRDNGYTLDEYYDDNVPLSPLPPQDLKCAGSVSGSSSVGAAEEYGELLDSTFFDRMSACGTSVGDRPAARSGTARAVSRHHSGRGTSPDVRIVGAHSTSATGFDEITSEDVATAIHQAATITTIYYLETAVSNLITQKQEKKPAADTKGKTGIFAGGAHTAAIGANKMEAVAFMEISKEILHEPPRYAPKSLQQKLALPPKPPNPYTSTKVLAAPRSKSIRYTQAQAGGVAVIAADSASLQQTAHTHQPSEEVSKKPVVAASAPRRSVLKKAKEVVGGKNPHPPQASQPSKKAPHRETKGARKVAAKTSVSDTRSLAEQTAADFIRAARANVDGLILLTSIDKSNPEIS